MVSFECVDSKICKQNEKLLITCEINTDTADNGPHLAKFDHLLCTRWNHQLRSASERTPVVESILDSNIVFGNGTACDSTLLAEMQLPAIQNLHTKDIVSCVDNTLFLSSSARYRDTSGG